MDEMFGWTLVREEDVAELGTRARLFRHLETGASLLSLCNDDENKVFGVTFRTPPADSTGIAHILEHAVLGGSEKYPLKEPFVQLVKGSLKTFLNAMTYPDRTVYPVASQNTQDLYNLMDVYLDAVLHPLVTREHLMQEGWHYELDSVDAPLAYKGVVFNEMKGAYSSPDNLLYRTSQQATFPDNAYGHDSGGDPRVIPQLTYEQFTDFHARYYHPGNGLFYCYGDDPEEERLRRIGAALEGFGASEVDSGVALQAAFAEPHRETRGFDAAEDDSAGNRGMVVVRWLLPESTDEELVMGLSLLSHALMGTQASPLRKRLIDSGYGEEVTGGGASASLRQMTFAAGLKGIDPENSDAVETLILDTLAELAEDGIETDMVEASYNTIEFSLRENNTGSYPRGLALMMRALRGWLYKDDPIEPLGYEAPLQFVRARLDEDPGYLQEMIRRYLVENPHRTTVLLRPEPGLNKRQEQAERAELDAARELMDDDDLQRIVAETYGLRERQERPDSPEELALLPSLGLADLDREVKTIPLEEKLLQGSRVFYHDLFTNGIVYLDLGMDLLQIPDELLPYAKLFGQSLVQMGTDSEDYVKLSQRIGRLTGGIYPSNYVSAVRNQRGRNDTVAQLFLHGKATAARANDLLDILRDVMLTVRLDNSERFHQIVLRNKANLESGLVPSGHSVVDGRLRSAFTPAGWASEQMSGVSYLQSLRALAKEIETDWSAVLEKLELVRSLLVNRSALLCNVTTDSETWQAFEPALDGFLAEMPVRPYEQIDWFSPSETDNEGLTLPAQVNYVGKGTNLYSHGYALHGSVSVITNYLRTSYLWDKVRAQGGAYGAFCRFGRQSGVFTFLSYRDPNLLATLDVYDAAPHFLRNADLSEDEIVKNIIGAIGALDAYQLPDAKGFTSLTRTLVGETEEMRQQYRDEVLGTSVADLRAFADVLNAVTSDGRVVVLGGEEAVRAASDEANLVRVERIL